jgi:urease accessory protein
VRDPVPPAVIVTRPRIDVSVETLEAKERDTLRLTWEERRWTRRRVTTTGGRAVALALPTGSVLQPGAVVAVEDGWYLEIEGCPEPVLSVDARDRVEAITVAFEVGNRHFPLALDGERLIVPDDGAMEQMLTRLGVKWDRRQIVFDPLGAGHRHAPGTSAIGGHSHHRAGS